jgi:hypothetical protein
MLPTVAIIRQFDAAVSNFKWVSSRARKGILSSELDSCIGGQCRVLLFARFQSLNNSARALAFEL